MNWSKQQLLKIRRNIHLASESLDDSIAAETPEIFRPWSFPKSYLIGDRFSWNNELYKVLQNHTSSEEWTPDIATSLYTKIKKSGEGTHDNPIVYNGNMELIENLYYIQNEVLYLCFRSTEIPVYNSLADLVGIYVEIAE